MTANTAPAKAGRREWLGLAVLALPTFVMAIDLFVLMLALPNLSSDLGATGMEQLWTMDIYGFMLAGFLVTMGTLGDRIGRRKLLMIGCSAFAVASLLCAYAWSPEVLIAARALLGIAGATLGPSTLSLIGTMFQDPKQQAAAFGIWGSVFTMGALFGPVIGGAMLTQWWWGSVFLLGVPFVIAALVLGPKFLPEFRNGQPGKPDLVSVALSLAALFPVIYGIKSLARDGFSAVAVVAVVVGVAAGWVFLRRQRTISDPLLDLSLFKNNTIGTSLAGQLSYSMTGGGIMLLMMLYFQLVQGMSTLEAGLAMVPGMAGGAIGFAVGPKLANKFRPAYVISAGLLGAALTLVWMTQISADSGTTALVVGFAIIAFCGAPMAGLGTNLVVTSAPPEKMGSAGSLAQMANEFGGTLGLAVLGTIGTAVYRANVSDSLPAGLNAETAEITKDSLAGATVAAGKLPAGEADALLAPARDAFTDGVQTVATIGAILLATMAVVVAVKLKHVAPFGAAQAPADGDGGDDAGLAPVAAEEAR
ncbi:MFS transporter [Actinokineospora sp.]|uniref:MFS transporter n=1 Tax=Actinokineospora sp. TaxID=1872133 RepID=UPI003D6B37DB